MALKLPNSAVEVDQRVKTDIQRELPESNPFLKNNWLSALATSFANRVFDFYIQLKEAFKQSLPDTATDEILERWAAIWGIIRLAATSSSGSIVATGTATTVIPLGTAYTSSDGLIYTTTGSVTITATVLNVSSITRTGTTATVTTTVDHGLASNVKVTIAGAVETDYNLSNVDIQVTASNQFTYQVANAPSTPATGTITASHTSIPVPVASQGFGEENNQVLDATLSLQSPIAGVDNDANVDFNELGGAVDQETNDELRTRLLERIQNPVAHFNVADIERKAKTVAGVTRVFVQEVTPALGQVTVYFMRDNDDDPIPTSPEVTDVKNALLEIKPANTSDANLIVSAPTGVPVNFTFTALSPDTTTMRTAVELNLDQFFSEETEVGVNIPEDAYRSAIYNTIDTETGDRVQSFTISAPSGDVVIASGEIGTKGTVTFP